MPRHRSVSTHLASPWSPIVTGLGGGTLRNLLVDLHPVAWIADPSYLVVCQMAAAFTFLWAHLLESRVLWLRIADALGLGLFAVAGTQVAIAAGTHGGIAIVMGVTTAIVGGMIRDILCNEVPLVLQKEIYALAALLGSALYVGLDAFGAGTSPAAGVAFTTCTGIRLACDPMEPLPPPIPCLSAVGSATRTVTEELSDVPLRLWDWLCQSGIIISVQFG